MHAEGNVNLNIVLIYIRPVVYYDISREKVLCALQHKRIPEEWRLFGDSFFLLGREYPRLAVDSYFLSSHLPM